MKECQVKIDFKILGLALQKHIREKASKSGSSIIYQHGDALIRENPRTKVKITIKKYPHIY